MSVEAHKQALRTHCLRHRKQLSLAERMSASNSICARIATLDQYQKATRIALYSAVNGEIDLSSLVLLPTQTAYYPVMNADRMLSFLPVTPKTVFIKNQFGIPEPDVKRERAITPERLDIIFLPLVAFDEHGTRLGLGGGYYDRTLARGQPALLIGVAYEFQRQSFIEREAWDVPLTAVMTQQTTYWSKP